MITGAHAIIYSTRPAEDRAFLRDVLHLSHVDAGEGWLIFGLPPAEVAVHPSEENDIHELYLICDDIADTVSDMRRMNVPCTDVLDKGWGKITRLTLPGGGQLGIYQPRHARPESGGTTLRRREPGPGGKKKRAAPHRPAGARKKRGKK